MRATTFSLSLLAFALSVTAYTEQSGPACTGSGACTFTFTNSQNQPITVNGYCAPNGYCADNGAYCQNDMECYNECGADNVCGGLLAMCTTKAAFQHDQVKQACFTPGFVCSSMTSGTCKKAASPAAKAKARREVQLPLDACPGESTACPVSHSLAGAFECVNTMESLERCGGCDSLSGGVDCSEIPNVADVACVAGGCVIKSCLAGFLNVKGQCI